MVKREYSAADINVLEFDAAVRKRPGMYFGVGLEDPRLPAMLLSAAARHGLHPATRVAEEHSLSTVIEILGDLSFRVTINQRHAWPDSPALGYYDSLIGPDWWLLAAIATLCETTTVEMWCDGQGFSQELAGLRPIAAVQRCAPPTGSGTRITFALDARGLLRGAAFPTDLRSLDAHGPDCVAADGPGSVVIRDHRHDGQTGVRLSCRRDSRRHRRPGM
ncbi:hypothetical protein AB0J28_33025 [Streptosporangium canum]|uniref:hypothetical protein n=1 Tax=Streptosporangium canum TaxID=324952 RepID=UPI00342D05C3